MEVIRLLNRDDRTIREAPGYLFNESELTDLHLCLLQPLLIGWDVFLIPETPEYIVVTSHDETTRIFTRTPETFDSMLEELRSWNGRQEDKRN